MLEVHKNPPLLTRKKKMLLITLAVIVLAAIGIGSYYYYLSTVPSPVESIWGQRVLRDSYIYDSQTDQLIFHEVIADRTVVMDLATGEMLQRVVNPGGIKFYVPGKYIHIGSQQVYDLANRKILPITVSTTYDYGDSKKLFEVNLAKDTENGAVIYSSRIFNNWVYLMIFESNAAYYEVNDNTLQFPSFEPMVTTNQLQGTQGVHSAEGTNNIKADGPDGYSVLITNDPSCTTLECGNGFYVEVTKDGVSKKKIKVADSKLKDVLAFPQGRKEVYLLGESQVNYIPLE